MSTNGEDAESELIQEMFEEIMKLIREKKIKLEIIVHRMIEREMLSHDSFERVYNHLTEFGKNKKWL